MKRSVCVIAVAMCILAAFTSCADARSEADLTVILPEIQVRLDDMLDEIRDLRDENEQLRREVERLERDNDGVERNEMEHNSPSDSNSPSGATHMFSVVQAFESGINWSYEENVTFTSLGIRYDNGAIFRNENQGATTFARYSLVGSDFTTVTGVLGHVDGRSIHRSRFNVLKDGIVSHTFEVYENMLPLHIEIDVTGVNILEFNFESRWAGGRGGIGLGNVMIE